MTIEIWRTKSSLNPARLKRHLRIKHPQLVYYYYICPSPQGGAGEECGGLATQAVSERSIYGRDATTPDLEAKLKSVDRKVEGRVAEQLGE